MGKTSWQVKAKYNKKTYKNFSTKIRPELLNDINKYCEENELSKPQFLKIAIDTLNFLEKK